MSRCRRACPSEDQREPDPTSCVASLTPVVARFIEHLTTIPSDKSDDYNSILADKSADYHDTRSVVARFPVVARFIELCLMNQASTMRL